MSATEFELEVHSDPAHYKYFDLTGGAIQVSFAVALFGWSLKNPSGSVAAAIDLYDGTDTTGNPIFPITLASSESVGDWFGPNGILLKNGIYANVTAGEVKGAVFYRRHWGQ